MVLLAACVAAIAATGVRFAGYGLPGWLDATFDPRFQAQQGRFPVLLDWLPHLGQLKAVTAMTFALLLACAITRRWRGAVLTVLAVPVAIGITDYVLKPTVGEAIGAAFPAGTPPAVSRWRPASPCCSPTRRSGCRPACGCCSCSWRS